MRSEALRVPLNGLDMHLRPSEIESVAAGLGEFDASVKRDMQGDLLTLLEALRQFPANDRAAAWELAIRRFGRHTPLPQAAGELGMDLIRARDLVDRFSQYLGAVRCQSTALFEAPANALRQSEV